MLKDAFQLHAQGRFAEAERAYRDLIRREPENFQALHLLGVLALQLGQGERAIALITQSLAIEPRQALAQRDLGNAYQQAGRLKEALDSYDKALALQPGLADAHNNRGITLAALERRDEALAAYGQAIALKPDYAQAYNNRGTVKVDLKRFREAVADFDKAIALKPDYIKATNNRGGARAELNLLPEALADHERAIQLAPNEAQSHFKRAGLLVRLGRRQDALESYDRAVLLDPRSAEGHDGRSTALMLLERPRDALEASDKALALNPQSATFHNNRGSALAALNRHQEALESYGKALSLAPNSATALSNTAAALSVLDRLGEALASVDRAIEAMPALTQAYINRGHILAELTRYDEALESFERALGLDPRSDEAHFGRAITLLRQGRFSEGWPSYEWRKDRVARAAFHGQGRPDWTGKEAIEGKTVFVEAEQGLGDTIQFCRYAPLIADLGARVIMTARKGQEGLLKTLDPRLEILGDGTLPDEFDYHVAMASLPFAFATAPDTIPARMPYLRAPPGRADYWRQKLGPQGFKVGIVWQGSVYSRTRSFALAQAVDLANLPGVRLISLQKGLGTEQLDALPQGMTVERLDEEYQAGDFAETAALVEALDLVVACDTAIVHVAGALARPVWLALADAADWRWLVGREDSPWYPSVRLFRQDRHGDWKGLFARMREGLEGRLKVSRRGEEHPHTGLD